MRLLRNLSLLALVLLAGFGALARSDEGKAEVKEKALEAPNKVNLRVRMEGPYTADVPLQVVCYFKYTPEGAKKMFEAPVELDKRLGGVIASASDPPGHPIVGGSGRCHVRQRIGPTIA